MESFVHLHVHSPFSFLDGASSLDTLVEEASSLGMPALALTDHDNVAGGVRFFKLAQKAGVKPIQGAEVTLEGDHHLVLLAKNAQGYANICRILSEGYLAHPPHGEAASRVKPQVSPETLRRYARDVFALSACRRGEVPSLILQRRYPEAAEAARRYASIFGAENFFLELQATRLPGDGLLNRRLAELAGYLGLGMAAGGNVHYARKENFPVHDLLTAVRTLTRLQDVHPERRLNAENYLKSPREMAEIFRDYPQALAATRWIADRCQPALDLSARLYPSFPVPEGETAAGLLRREVYRGATRRYGRITTRVRARLEHELEVITRLGYEDYFLLVWDVSRWARERGIRSAGRGSAADSAVAYCLGITEVDAIGRRLMFERFLSLERAEKPDIDIDFDARHRDRVADYVYTRYGRDHVAAVSTYNTYWARSAVRDLGKAMDLPAQEVDALAKRLPWGDARKLRETLERYPELRNSGIPLQKFDRLIAAGEQVIGFPRFMGTHLGGLVISRDPLTQVTPLQWSAKGVVVTQFDKEYVEDLGLVKLDLLSLRTLSAVEDAVRAINRTGPVLDYDRLGYDDPATYRRLNRGETIGVFQLESPAQRALQARLGADNLEDVVASVAIIRPGPVRGNMVEPFIARRRGDEPVSYLHPKLQPILEKTYGVVLFQEQVIEIATVIAGFTPGEADQLRRVMTHARNREEMEEIGRVFVKKATSRGISPEVAETVFSYIVGYASYGFCEAHAAAFASIAYKTAYLLEHHPAEFYAAILSHQPMGYYPPNTICIEARRRGIPILPVDINRSKENFQVEEGGPGGPAGRSSGGRSGKGMGIRVSLKQVRGMTRPALQAILDVRSAGGPFTSFDDFLERVSAPRNVVENLVLAGAFDGVEGNRRRLLWRLTGIVAPSGLEDFSPQEKFWREYQLLGIMVRAHIMSHWRERLGQQGFVSSGQLRRAEEGETVKVAGLPVRPHRPPTKSGRTIVYLSLEDEEGLTDLTIFEDVYQRYGQLIFCDPAPPLKVLGQVQRRGNGVSVVVRRIAALF